MSQLIDEEAREGILNNEGNILVSASAGSGKTTIMVKKMALELEKIQDHRTIAAITFTVKATNEIKKKASKIINKTFAVMTNDSFIESEIIRPFISDSLGVDFTNDYTVDYDNNSKFSTYEKGLIQLKNQKILGGFYDKKLNFNFKLALNILQSSQAAQEYIMYKYAVIFIDEYQDSDIDMHHFFMYLKNKLKIKLFIVGDEKQAIYRWRGAMSDIFSRVRSQKFNAFELVTNFRCHHEIENYANLFHNTNYFRQQSDKTVKNIILKKYMPADNRKFDDFIIEFDKLISLDLIDLEKEVTIISNLNDDARAISELLQKGGYDFVFIPKLPIEDGLPNGLLLKELALYCKNDSYSIFDFIENSHIDERNQTRIEIESIVKNLKKSKKLSKDNIAAIVSNLANYFSIVITKSEIDKFIESVTNNIYDMAFQITEKKHVVMTVFSSKGLEFDQVISFSRYYNLYKNQHKENHYVSITRAKEKFIMMIDDSKYYDHFKQELKKQQVNNVKQVAYCVR